MQKSRHSNHIVIDARIRQASTGRPVRRLLDHLQKLDKKNRYTVLLKPDDPWKPSSKNFSGKSCKYKVFSLNPIQQLAFSEWLYRLKPDLVHFTLTGQQPLFYFGKQVTFTHDLTIFKYSHSGRLPKWLHWLRVQGYAVLMWSAHRKATTTHVPTEYVKDMVNKRYLHTNRRTVVTYEAADEPKISNIKKPKVELNTDFIMYVGNAFPHKNLHMLCNSFGILLKEKPNLQLVLVGNLDYHAKKFRKWVRSQPFGESVVFTGFVEDEELSWFYKNSLAYVFPSLSEGFGLPGLEAMAHDCALVSSNATCLPEVYGEAAEYFDPQDIEGMAKAIKKVISDGDRRKELIKLGRRQSAKYSWKTMSEQIYDMYQTVLGQ
jgi:glycosyltransferase involved in cell wall biosynthesis